MRAYPHRTRCSQRGDTRAAALGTAPGDRGALQNSALSAVIFILQASGDLVGVISSDGGGGERRHRRRSTSFAFGRGGLSGAAQRGHRPRFRTWLGLRVLQVLRPTGAKAGGCRRDLALLPSRAPHTRDGQRAGRRSGCEGVEKRGEEGGSGVMGWRRDIAQRGRRGPCKERDGAGKEEMSNDG